MRRLVLALVLLTAPLDAQERAEVTTPITLTVNTFEISEFRMTRLPEWSVMIVAVDNQGRRVEDRHRGQTTAENPTGARDLIIALNKANLSTASLERRLLQHLIQEKLIPAATVTGTPQ